MPSRIIFEALRGVSEGGGSPPSGNKKIFVFFVGVVLVVLKLVVSWYPSWWAPCSLVSCIVAVFKLRVHITINFILQHTTIEVALAGMG
jgi:hypothetical protein